MGRKLSVGALVAALLVSGLLVGISQGGPTPLFEPTMFKLHEGDPPAHAVVGGHVRAASALKGKHRVGNIRMLGTGSGSDYHLTIVYVLKRWPRRGTIVATGMFREFDGDRLAITGGTGAFVGVGGFVRLTVEDGKFTHTFHLLPCGAWCA